MQILIVSPTPSHPQDAGNRQRIFSLVSALKSLGHTIHFCFIHREKVSEHSLSLMEEAWDAFYVVPHDRRVEKKTKGDSFGLDDWFTNVAQETIETIASSFTFDVVIAEYVFISKALNLFSSRTIKVIDTHDVFGDRHLRLKEVGLEPSFFYTPVAEEDRGLSRADLVLAIQDEEAAVLSQRSLAAVHTIGFIPCTQRIMVSNVASVERSISKLRIGYFGSANPINTNSLKNLISAEGFSELLADGAELIVGGQICNVFETTGAGIILTGEYDDAREFYSSVDVVVNPHLGGTGVKIKTIEALWNGLPVIGTVDAFVGMSAREPFHQAATTAQLVQHLASYLRDKSFRRHVAEASAAVIDAYELTVSRSLEPFRTFSSLLRFASKPRSIIVTDIPFWLNSLGNHARIIGLINALSQVSMLDIFVFRTISSADRSLIQKLTFGRCRIYSFKDYPVATSEIPWIEKSDRRSAFERKQYARAYFSSLEQHYETYRYDFCIIEYIRLSYLRHAKFSPKIRVLDTHDIMSLRCENFSQFGLKHHIEITEEEELGIMNGFELLLAIQGSEFQYLVELFPGRVLYAPHVVTVDKFSIPKDRATRLVFVGGDSPMNRDGLQWFLRQVWPCLASYNVELHIAGSVCSSLAGLNEPGLTLHGLVDDLPGFLEAADIAINPVYYGGGLKIKTVEYLCYGIPSVLTEEAVFGILGGDGEAFLVAHDRSEFVEHLVRLIEDGSLRIRMHKAAKDFGQRNFGPQVLLSAASSIADISRARARLVSSPGMH